MSVKWQPIAIILSLGLCLGIYQNCSNPVPYGSRDFYSELVSSSDFPYDVGFDQLAYTSCSEQDDVFNDGTFFTFRAVAYNDMGLRINNTFRESVEFLTDSSVVAALQENLASSGTQIQFGVRTLDNLEVMFIDTDNGATGQLGLDYETFFPMMGDPALSRSLWELQPGAYLRNYVEATFTSEYRFEADIDFTRTRFLETDLRSFLNDRGILAMTFVETGEIFPLGPGSFQDTQGANNNSPEFDTRRNVFGFAVQPRFRQPSFMRLRRNAQGVALGDGSSPAHFEEWFNPGADLPPRVLSDVIEVQIDQRPLSSVARPWQCDRRFQFMIVLPEHAQYTVNLGTTNSPNLQTFTRCAMRPDPVPLTPDLQRLRQSFYSEDWFIDMDRRCIVPKPGNVEIGSCYGRNSSSDQTYRVNYEQFETEGCGYDDLQNGLCPHFASLCFRQ